MITYAKSNGPPAYWRTLEVINLDTGKPVSDLVFEVNTDEGWYMTYQRGDDGRYLHNDVEFLMQRIEGRFAIRRKRG